MRTLVLLVPATLIAVAEYQAGWSLPVVLITILLGIGLVLDIFFWIEKRRERSEHPHRTS